MQQSSVSPAQTERVIITEHAIDIPPAKIQGLPRLHKLGQLHAVFSGGGSTHKSLSFKLHDDFQKHHNWWADCAKGAQKC
jgi:hypothetical protein